ncbi:MAG TPA: hypothetical protein GX708_09810 [Gallicola sp.]|nr:hypothetical protein [Gallicola sp.]
MLNKYYASKIEEEIIVMWAMDLLEEFDYEDIIVAIKSYKKNETYPPTLAGIIKYIPQQKIDYAQLILDTVRKYDSNSEKGKQSLSGDEVALDLYIRYGQRIGMSEPYSTSQKFLFQEVNDEAEAKIKYNKQTVNYIENKDVKKLEEQKLLERGKEWKKKRR